MDKKQPPQHGLSEHEVPPSAQDGLLPPVPSPDSTLPTDSPKDDFSIIKDSFQEVVIGKLPPKFTWDKIEQDLESFVETDAPDDFSTIKNSFQAAFEDHKIPNFTWEDLAEEIDRPESTDTSDKEVYDIVRSGFEKKYSAVVVPLFSWQDLAARMDAEAANGETPDDYSIIRESFEEVYAQQTPASNTWQQILLKISWLAMFQQRLGGLAKALAGAATYRWTAWIFLLLSSLIPSQADQSTLLPQTPTNTVYPANLLAIRTPLEIKQSTEAQQTAENNTPQLQTLNSMAAISWKALLNSNEWLATALTAEQNAQAIEQSSIMEVWAAQQAEANTTTNTNWLAAANYYNTNTTNNNNSSNELAALNGGNLLNNSTEGQAAIDNNVNVQDIEVGSNNGDNSTASSTTTLATANATNTISSTTTTNGAISAASNEATTNTRNETINTQTDLGVTTTDGIPNKIADKNNKVIELAVKNQATVKTLEEEHSLFKTLQDVNWLSENLLGVQGNKKDLYHLVQQTINDLSMFEAEQASFKTYTQRNKHKKFRLELGLIGRFRTSFFLMPYKKADELPIRRCFPSSSAGAMVQAYLSQNDALVLGIYPISTVKQHIINSAPNHHEYKDIKLSYLDFTLGYQRTLLRYNNMTNMPIRFYGRLEVGLGYLTRAKTLINTQPIPGLDHYNRLNLSVGLSFGNIHEFKHFILDYGVGSDWGVFHLSDIGVGTHTVLEPAHLLNVGCYVSIRYKLLAKMRVKAKPKQFDWSPPFYIDEPSF